MPTRGLSPLARGTPYSGITSTLRLRFIPAGAGNTRPFLNNSMIGSVYPRWRGEHRHGRRNTAVSYGLSPLARGTLCHPCIAARMPRFIPAGAGNTAITSGTSWLGAVYPRWRGEHAMNQVKKLKINGLSPLARGTQCSYAPSDSAARFIPAGAGNTNEMDAGIYYAPVYPRWRGEHVYLIRYGTHYFGLSPLARGTLVVKSRT